MSKFAANGGMMSMQAKNYLLPDPNRTERVGEHAAQPITLFAAEQPLRVEGLGVDVVIPVGHARTFDLRVETKKKDDGSEEQRWYWRVVESS